MKNKIRYNLEEHLSRHIKRICKFGFEITASQLSLYWNQVSLYEKLELMETKRKVFYRSLTRMSNSGLKCGAELFGNIKDLYQELEEQRELSDDQLDHLEQLELMQEALLNYLENLDEARENLTKYYEAAEETYVRLHRKKWVE